MSGTGVQGRRPGARAGRRAAALTLAATLGLPAGASAFDPAREAQNYAKISERHQHVVLTPEFQARLTQQTAQDNLDQLQIQAEELAAEPADRRNFTANVCFQRKEQCAGDVRFYDWDGIAGTRTPVLYTARSGATISGNVWATEDGPARRPGIVITSGSVQAPETLYWGLAATLAKNGYVVLTYDVQGQSRSDTFGEAPDENEGVPSQAGQPFFDGTEEALDFLLSAPEDPYVPRKSCGNANEGIGTSHAAKHERRVAAGLNAAHNPFAHLVDPSRIGVAGQSLGAGAVSYVGQIDPRVDAIVGWDNLRAPDTRPECPSGSSPRPEDPAITKPALGVSNDYGIAQTPYTSDPDPQGKNGAFGEYQAAGVDSMQVNIRGGTHFEAAFIPGSFTPVPLGAATLRGNDLAAWYTTAWLDKYVKCPGVADPRACEEDADDRLMTDRWRDDAPGRAVDAADDPNVFSFYFRSRFDFEDASGTRQACDDMRAGCPNMAPDDRPLPYSFVADAYRADDPGDPGGGGERCFLPQRGGGDADTPKTLPPTDGGDAIRGGEGNDRLRGGAGADCLYGEAGGDALDGDGGDDRVVGGAGADRVVGGQGVDRLLGGAGPDRLLAVDGERDVIRCGAGEDRAVIDAADTTRSRCERVTRRD